MKSISTADSAREYLGRGWAPIPLRPRSKIPIGEKWNHQRLNEDDISSRFAGAENIGILLGEPSNGLVDIDLDCPEAIAAARRFLPHTAAQFGRKSLPNSHCLYRVTDSLASERFLDVPSTDVSASDDGERAMICEIRSSALQTVFPPSVHPSGEIITWAEFGEPSEIDAKVLRRGVAATASCALLARHWPATGTRHNFALALSGCVLRINSDLELCCELIEEAASIAGDEESQDRRRAVEDTSTKLNGGGKATGLPTLAAIVGDDLAREITLRLEVWLELEDSETGAEGPPELTYKDFPVGALPEPLRSFVSETSRALGCDAAFVALPLLTVVAAAIGNSRVIELKRDWTEPAILWTTIIGESGTLKSPALDKSLLTTRRRQARAIDLYREEENAYERDLEEYERARREFRKGDDAGDPPRRPDPPVAERFLVSDITVESLALILQDAPRGVLLARDELAGWLGSFDQYKKGKSDAAQWLEMHRGGSLLVDRKTGQNKIIQVSRASVSITGGIQPGSLRRALSPEYLENGLAARLLMAMPPRRPRKWSDAEIPTDLFEKLASMTERLWALTPDIGEDGEPSPVSIRLTPDAKKKWVGFYDAHGKEQVKLKGPLAATWSKLEAYAARFALVGHLAAGSDKPVAVESVEAGITLARWFGEEARRIYGYLAASDDDTDRNGLVAKIRRHRGRTTPRKLSQADRRFRNNVDGARQALDSLVIEGLGRWEDIKPGPSGGRPTREFVLHDSADVYETSDGESPAEDPSSAPTGTSSGDRGFVDTGFVDTDSDEVEEWSA